MKKPGLINLFVAMVLLALSVTASAHDSRHYGDRRDGALSGGVTVWVDPYGRVAYGGTLGYTIGGGYAPGSIPWISHQHGPACGHAPVHVSRHVYRELERHRYHGQSYRGKGHGPNHGKKHGKKHGRKQHGRRH